MNDCVLSSGETKVFTFLSALGGYWQVPIKNDDKNKNKYIFHSDTYGDTPISFGLQNVPATIQCAWNIIRYEAPRKACLLNIDIIIIFGKDSCQHVKDIAKVLTLLYWTGIVLNLPNGYNFKRNF